MPDMSDRRAKSFEYASDATKQLIGLATGVVAFTVTFGKDFLSGLPHGLQWVAIVAWVLFLGSAITGLLILYALAGQLDPGDPSIPEERWSAPSIWAGAVRVLMMSQQVCFGAALVVTIVFAGIAVLEQPAAGAASAGTVEQCCCVPAS